MTKFFGAHPGVIGLLLGVGAALALYFGYDLYQGDDLAEKTNSNYALKLAIRWGTAGLGVIMYLAGGVLYGTSRGLNGLLSLLLHLMPVLGLILLTVFGRRMTPHELWQRQNPGLDEKTLKRNYRSMKSLY